jgi:hypothetical protein
MHVPSLLHESTVHGLESSQSRGALHRMVPPEVAPVPPPGWAPEPALEPADPPAAEPSVNSPLLQAATSPALSMLRLKKVTAKLG